MQEKAYLCTCTVQNTYFKVLRYFKKHYNFAHEKRK